MAVVFAGSIPSRVMYAVLHDVYNIRSEFKLLAQAVNAEEFISLRAEFEKQKLLPFEKRTLIFLKNKRETVPMYPNLTDMHFLAIVQNEIQRDMLRRCGGKGICIDATRGVGKDKNVKLVTMVVLDDCERGIPVAYG